MYISFIYLIFIGSRSNCSTMHAFLYVYRTTYQTCPENVQEYAVAHPQNHHQDPLWWNQARPKPSCVCVCVGAGVRWYVYVCVQV